MEGKLMFIFKLTFVAIKALSHPHKEEAQRIPDDCNVLKQCVYSLQETDQEALFGTLALLCGHCACWWELDFGWQL